MKRFVTLGLVIAAGLAAAPSQAASWPAHCHTMRCVSKHLNALHQQVADIVDSSVPQGNALQAELDALAGQEQGDVQNLASQLDQVWAQPALSGCWQPLAVSRYPDVASEPGGVYTDGWPYNDYAQAGPTSGGVLDLAHSDQPRNGFIYRVLFNACTSG